METGSKRKSKMSQKDSNQNHQNDIYMTTNQSALNTTALTSNNKKESALKFSKVNM
jgi:hypothetical protein